MDAPHKDGDALLSALSTGYAFSPEGVSRQSVVQDDEPQRTDNPDAASSATPPAADAAVTDPGERIEAPDESKAYYDAQVQSWRQQSAQARERAEKKRAEWEEIRAAERAEVARLKAEASAHGQGGERSREPSQALPLPSGIPSHHATKPTLERHDTADETKLTGSQKWEDVPSVTSSLPSMSFPERSGLTSPELAARNAAAASAASAAAAATAGAHPSGGAHPPSATLAIFDSSLPAAQRARALFSSLAINLLLPFVNGVMLGFGEIFAKNVVLKWFGWGGGGGPSGSAAARVGIGKGRK